MAQFFQIHPANPQPRLIRGVVEILRDGGVIVYPTDSSYALGCQLGPGRDGHRRIRGLDTPQLHLVCRDLSEITTYAKIDNQAFRILKADPGPSPSSTRQPSRSAAHAPKALGIGIASDNAICRALLAELDEPILSASLLLPGTST
jgi:tRNA A37 threonylcarbamoyladenosine synthetase subunit TsaC/SUA5/YrdC